MRVLSVVCVRILVFCFLFQFEGDPVSLNPSTSLTDSTVQKNNKPLWHSTYNTTYAISYMRYRRAFATYYKNANKVKWRGVEWSGVEWYSTTHHAIYHATYHATYNATYHTTYHIPYHIPHTIPHTMPHSMSPTMPHSMPYLKQHLQQPFHAMPYHTIPFTINYHKIP